MTGARQRKPAIGLFIIELTVRTYRYLIRPAGMVFFVLLITAVGAPTPLRLSFIRMHWLAAFRAFVLQNDMPAFFRFLTCDLKPMIDEWMDAFADAFALWYPYAHHHTIGHGEEHAACHILFVYHCLSSK